MLIGSLVKLLVGLHSCLCFSHLEKLVLNVVSTPPRYLAVCRASSAFSNHNPDSCLIPSGSIENGSASSIASRHLVDRSSFCCWFCWVVPQHLLNTLAVDYLFLDTFLDRYLDTSRYLHLSRFTAGTISAPCVIWNSFHSISLSILLSFLSQTFSSHSNLCSSRILQAFSRISSLGKLLILSHSCISCFET